MSRYSNNSGCDVFIFYIGVVYFIIMIGGEIWVWASEHPYEFKMDFFPWSLCAVLSLISFFAIRRIKSKHKEECQKIEKEYDSKKWQLEKEYDNKHKKLEQEYCNKNAVVLYREEQITKILKSSAPFTYSASLYSDAYYILYEKDENYLRYKPHPSRTSADKLKELRGKFRDELMKVKAELYKYEYIVHVFPELAEYIEDEEALIDLGLQGLDDIHDNYDHARDFLSAEEWNKLSENKRNQLALDRYKQRRRNSNWKAGIEFEMYCSYVLRTDGFSVIEQGAERKHEDLGRDIIAYKNGNLYIIQCKRYSERHQVHENTICQLYGTTIHYKLAHEEEGLFGRNENVTPLLLYTGNLSDTAMKFAKRLGIITRNVQMGEYPMIKCNINNGNKIYHLPFDQQYWSTKITMSSGEFYAWTVEEATSKGFRRAYRWQGNNR